MKRGSYRPKYPVQTLEKSLDVLFYMVNHPCNTGIAITEISENTGIGKSGVHRILDTYLSYGIVEKQENAQTYRLGWGLYELGLSVPATNSLLSTNYAEVISDLCGQVAETVNLGIRSDDEVVIIHKREPTSRLHANISVGEREPMHATGMGKIFLSEFSDQEVRDYYSTHEVVQMTENSIMTADEMIPELDKVRRQGYAVDTREYDRDLICVAMPIRDYTGGIAAAMSVSGHTSHMDEDQLEKILAALGQAVSRLSLSMGYNQALVRQGAPCT